MKRLIFALIMSLIFLTILWFVYCNLGQQAFGYEIVFRFSIPLVGVTYESAPVPMGFVVVVAFCLGMIAIALLEALPSFYKTLEIRSKNRKIRQLERELAVVRQMSRPSEPQNTVEDEQ
jgi:hypothetical protein